MRTLLIDQHEEHAGMVQTALAQSGFAVDVAHSLDDASAAFDCASYDILLLELSLPDGSGLSWLKQLRRNGHAVPAMIMSAIDDPQKRIEVYNGGADDFLPKPLAAEELVARMRALLRRSSQITDTTIRAGNLSFDPIGRQAYVNETALKIARRELCILEVLLNRLGRVVPRGSLEESIYTFDEEVSANALEVGVYRLRCHLSQSRADLKIRTVRGIGYTLEIVSEAETSTPRLSAEMAD
ncbi:response regulator [Terrihabitans sp. B22-R8]|uniref:response regulator n=1 Tax=Terrihabitans sp. B22-R8 TaxID=3425128 RepID=UPI00403C35B2